MQVLLMWKIVAVSTVLFRWLVKMRHCCDYLCSRIRL